MKRKLYLMIALLVALAVAGGSFAYTQTSSSVSTGVSSGSFATVEAWSASVAWDKYGTLPDWTPVQGTAGPVTAGDLYYIQNPSGYTGNLLIMVYLTNSGDLADAYSYLNMKVQAYDYASGSPGTWTSKSLDYYLTLSNGYVSFILPAASGDGYVITIDGGSSYCINGSGTLSPSFYIDVRQA